MWRSFALTAFLLGGLSTAVPALADRVYDPGITDTEITIGNTMAYSGPVSAAGIEGRVMSAYFDMINEQGGINGRKIKFLSYDDGFSPPKTVEQTRKLVEQDHVALMFATMGTAPSSAIRQYLNTKKVPQLFVVSTASKWNDPKGFPWSMPFPWSPNYAAEAAAQVRYVLKDKPDARFAVLYENDDAGKEYLSGTKAALGANADKALVAVESFEVTDPSVDSQIISLSASKADVFLNYSVTPRACSQAIREGYDIGWLPIRMLTSACTNPDTVLKPAGLEKAKGMLSLIAFKQATEASRTDPEMAKYLAFMQARLPEAEPRTLYGVYAYSAAQAMIVVLQQCGDDVSRANLMRQATNLHDVPLPLLLPGIKMNTSPEDFAPIQSAYMARFDGETWVQFGDLISAK
jgi:ABC-type branched-subunit amino acid transport system substrate-binding protein